MCPYDSMRLAQREMGRGPQETKQTLRADWAQPLR